MKKRYLALYTSATSSSTIRYKEIYWRHAYEGLFFELLALGVTPVLVYDQENTYAGEGTFRAYWEVGLDSEGKLTFEHHDAPIKLYFIFSKNRFIGSDVAVSDPAVVREICRDKYLSYLFVPELHPRSFLIGSGEQLEALRRGWGDGKVALKELDSNGGKKVYVGEWEGYDGALEYPLLAQEFIDTAVGVPGICEGRHDLRVVVYNGEIISFLLRQPPEDGLKSNLAYGGGHRELDLTEVPAELRKITEELDKRFGTEKDRFYSIDFGNTAEGWKIFELNAWPGLGYESEGEKAFTRRLVRRLVDSLERQMRLAGVLR